MTTRTSKVVKAEIKTNAAALRAAESLQATLKTSIAGNTALLKTLEKAPATPAQKKVIAETKKAQTAAEALQASVKESITKAKAHDKALARELKGLEKEAAKPAAKTKAAPKAESASVKAPKVKAPKRAKAESEPK